MERYKYIKNDMIIIEAEQYFIGKNIEGIHKFLDDSKQHYVNIKDLYSGNTWPCPIKEGEWVIKTSNSNYDIMKDEYFKEYYTLIPLSFTEDDLRTAVGLARLYYGEMYAYYEDEIIKQIKNSKC